MTKANGDASDPIVRPCDSGIKGIIDADARFIVLHLYDAFLKVPASQLPLQG